jgi:manganese transport protein
MKTKKQQSLNSEKKGPKGAICHLRTSILYHFMVIMHLLNKFKDFFIKDPSRPGFSAAKEIFKYIGPGLLVTVGFIDPGNWASNVAAGSQFGYSLLWIVTLSTIMLIILQHNTAHIGIVTGLCLAESANKNLQKWFSRSVLITAMFAIIATALAEILGAAIGLKMLFNLDLRVGAALSAIFVLWMILSNSYQKLEKWIIGFVSFIGVSFLVELLLTPHIDWMTTATSFVVPSFPQGAILVIVSVLGAVVMPHNLYLHSEFIQSRQYNLEGDDVIKKRLDMEFIDTLFSMVIGWAINASMIIIAAAVFFANNIEVTELEQAKAMLAPLVGPAAAIIFALALLAAGIASSVTAGMASGTIFAGMIGEQFDLKDKHSRAGIIITIVFAAIAVIVIASTGDPFKALVISQATLSLQLPLTIIAQIMLTSSPKVMGKYANSTRSKILLWTIATIVIILNVWLLIAMFWPK